jgi:uncharacterized protein YecT (DUF1311 family)
VDSSIAMKMKYQFVTFTIVGLAGMLLGLRPMQATPLSDAAQPFPTIRLEPAGVNQPDCVRELEAGEYRCAKRWAETTDLLKSLVYQDVESQLSPTLQRQLATTDQTWQQFQTQHCEQLSQQLRNTPDAPLVESVCLARLNNDRVLELQNGGEVITDQARNPQYESLLDQLKLRNSPAQLQWEQYQTQHCQLERDLFPQNHHQFARCHQRLRHARLLQLENLFEAPYLGLALSQSSKSYGINKLNCVDDSQIGLNRCAVYWSKTTDKLRGSISAQ